MYDKGVAGVGSVVAGGSLAELGAGMLWAVLGGFALFAAWQAALRILPRRHA